MERRKGRPQASYKLNNIQIVTNDAARLEFPLRCAKQKFVKGESESYQANEIKVHVITMRNEWFASATIASVKKNCSRNPFSYAFHQLVFI